VRLCRNSGKYLLGVHLQGDRSHKFDVNPSKRPLYTACNSIFFYHMVMSLHCFFARNVRTYILTSVFIITQL